MELHKIDLKTRHGKGFFLLWVCVWDTHDWRVRPYLFKYKEGKVYFRAGGTHGEKRFSGKAQNIDDAIDVAINYLEQWLKECNALEHPGRPKADCNEKE